MSNFDAVEWFALGCIVGGAVASLALHRWAIGVMRKSIKVYHDADDLIEGARKLMDEDDAAAAQL